jgi:hypothetical protein
MPIIESYNNAVNFFATAKNKENGKPILSFARMFQRGEDYTIHIGNQMIAKISPDNTLEYCASLDEYRNVHTTISSSLDRVIDVKSIRVGKNKYRIGHVKWLGRIKTPWGSETHNWQKLRSEGQEYFQGVKIDLHSGEVINPRADMSATINPENRKTWLRALRSFKNGIHVRQKLGVFDGLINEMQLANANRWDHRTSFTGDKIDILVRNMKNGTFEDDLMRLFVRYTRGQIYGQIRGEHVSKMAFVLLKDMSVPLRREFEVFEDA